MAFVGHESWVLSVACHPSGSSFATGSSDAKVKLWDLQTRTCAQTLSDHTDQVLVQSSLPSCTCLGLMYLCLPEIALLLMCAVDLYILDACALCQEPTSSAALQQEVG